MNARVRIGSRPASDGWRSIEELKQADREAFSSADYVVVEGPAAALRRALPRLKRLDAAVQPIVIAEEDQQAAVEKVLLFTPGAGEVWVVSPEEAEEDGLYDRAREITRKRRSFRQTRSKLRTGIGDARSRGSARAQVSDAFLAALLDVIPDPVLSLDEAGRVISANRAAETVLGRSAADMEDAPLTEALGRAEGELDSIIRQFDSYEEEILFYRSDGSCRTGEIAIAPVVTSALDVRCVVLRDVTEERRVRGQLEEQAAELEEQAVEYEMVNQELQERTEELERAMESRSRFYAAMSHELRTPLNAVIGYNELILERVVGEIPESVVKPLERSQQAAFHLLELVNDVLDLAKIEAGRIDLQVGDVYFPDLLNELLDTVRPLAEQHGSELRISGSDPAHTIRSDGRRVRQIVLNLLSNALKFGEGSAVDVEWSRLPDGGVEICVTDRGIGIPEDQLAGIFEEFVQLSSGDGGTGLGLAISTKLAGVLGGRVEAESTAGEGSTFKLILPAAPDRIPEDATLRE